MPERLAVAATAPFGASVLEGLAARREISFLITRPDRPAGRGRLPGRVARGSGLSGCLLAPGEPASGPDWALPRTPCTVES